MSSSMVDEYDEIFASDDAFLAGLSDTDLQPAESLSGVGSVAHPMPGHSTHSASVLVQDSLSPRAQNEDTLLPPMAPSKPVSFEMLSPADFGAVSSAPETISMVDQAFKPKRGRPKKVVTDSAANVKPTRQKGKVAEVKDSGPKRPVGRPPNAKPNPALYLDRTPLRSISTSSVLPCPPVSHWVGKTVEAPGHDETPPTSASMGHVPADMILDRDLHPQTHPSRRVIIPAVDTEQLVSSDDPNGVRDYVDLGLDGDGLGTDDFTGDDVGHDPALHDFSSEPGAAGSERKPLPAWFTELVAEKLDFLWQKDSQNCPQLYSEHGTFWLPRKCGWFNMLQSKTIDAAQLDTP